VSAIVVGTDGSAVAERAVRRAIWIAKGTGAQLHLVTAYPDGPYRESIAGTARRTEIDLREAAESVGARDVAEDAGTDLLVVRERQLTRQRQPAWRRTDEAHAKGDA
jgi:nucleotide-binding universal stress UspA family protein